MANLMENVDEENNLMMNAGEKQETNVSRNRCARHSSFRERNRGEGGERMYLRLDESTFLVFTLSISFLLSIRFFH